MDAILSSGKTAIEQGTGPAEESTGALNKAEGTKKSETVSEANNSVSFLSIKTDSLTAQRQTYGIPLDAFAGLPFAPADFSEKTFLTRGFAFNNYSKFSEEYYIQPEFYPSFPQNAVSYWKNPDLHYYGAIGYGFFPAGQRISLVKGESASVRFFVHSGYGVQSWQGLKIVPVNDNGNSGIEVGVLDSESLLGPNYPVFSKEWAKSVDAVITASKDAKSGKYVLRIGVASPSDGKNSEWAEQHFGKYFNASMAGNVFYPTIEVEVQ